VVEWSNTAVLKTVRPQKGLVGSNPTPSASQSGDFSPFPYIVEEGRFSGPTRRGLPSRAPSLIDHANGTPRISAIFSATNREVLSFAKTLSGRDFNNIEGCRPQAKCDSTLG
jgi:hypothetical protein